MEAGATIYVSGVDVVDGSAVSAAEICLPLAHARIFWIHGLLIAFPGPARLDIKPYHPVDAVGQATPVEEGTCNRQERA